MFTLELRSDTTTITHVPRRLDVMQEHVGNSWLVHMRASVIVKVQDPVFQRVRAMLEERCFTVVESDTVDDETMWFGRSRVSVLQIHDSCPSTDHSCQHKGTSIAEALGME